MRGCSSDLSLLSAGRPLPKLAMIRATMQPTRTKVVATLGPALDASGALEALLSDGGDVLRLNLWHGDPTTQVQRVSRARAAKPDVAILADLCGPKLRLGELDEPVQLSNDDTVILGPGGLPVADPSFAK